MARAPIAVVVAIAAIALCSAIVAGTSRPPPGRDETVKPNDASNAAIATGQKPATVQVKGNTKGVALEVTARPVGGESSSPPYLVGVFVGEGQAGVAPKMLGSFSFFPPRAGQAETFVIPRPEPGDTAPGKDVTLSFKLIPANPAADIKDAAVEILGAQVK